MVLVTIQTNAQTGPELLRPACHSSATGEERQYLLYLPIGYESRDDWLYEMAQAIEDAGHPDVRITVHEDMGHDAWTRVCRSLDFYDWLLSNERQP